MDDDRCEDVLVLDLRGLSTVCDLFVIATGTSDRQLRSVSEHIDDLGRARGERPFTRSGLDTATWIVLDYVDVVVHLFDAEHRRYYELETLWGDAPRIDWGKRRR
jgi:ribosome-associated protein